ncbi:DUF6152 family protein [Pararobbsia alpina]|uniref:DUF5666 domain-containing protein n=1 Tax=Pararobbsia alpina TaxID=621374 RepID=A0A6S7BER0_9BURK|nr:DUF6152 family protein [Pararobbsia alpina]CAB3797938.1 hypothetical protein LMG28138_04350 [Pararobbsia alpina]
MHIKSLLTGITLTLIAITATAHHGWSSYDSSKVLKIEAPLSEVRYRNPHAEVTIQYQGSPWEIVLAPISRMEARGLPEQALTVGKVVTIEGYPRQDGVHEIRAERITVDGKTTELR